MNNLILSSYSTKESLYIQRMKAEKRERDLLEAKEEAWLDYVLFHSLFH